MASHADKPMPMLGQFERLPGRRVTPGRSHGGHTHLLACEHQLTEGTPRIPPETHPPEALSILVEEEPLLFAALVLFVSDQDVKEPCHTSSLSALRPLPPRGNFIVQI